MTVRLDLTMAMMSRMAHSVAGVVLRVRTVTEAGSMTSDASNSHKRARLSGKLGGLSKSNQASSGKSLEHFCCFLKDFWLWII